MMARELPFQICTHLFTNKHRRSEQISDSKTYDFIVFYSLRVKF